MKKILVWLLMVSLVTSLAWLLAKPRAGKGSPTPAVTAIIESASVSAGAEIVEKRVVSGSLRPATWNFESLKLGIDRSLDRPVYDNLASFRIVQGGQAIQVTCHQSASETGRIEITPESGAAGLAADLKAALLKAFPDLPCEIIAP